MPRLFTAIDLPKNVEQRIFLLKPQAANIRPQHQLHITLHYIGSVSEAITNAIHLELSKVASCAFRQTLSGVGFFSHKKKRHILWAGVDKCPNLYSLHTAIGRALVATSIVLEGRDYHPHITIARINRPSQNLMASFLKEHEKFEATFEVSSFSLYASEQQEGIVRYIKLQDYGLQE